MLSPILFFVVMRKSKTKINFRHFAHAIKKYENIQKQGLYKVRFRWFYNPDGKVLNGTPMIPGEVAFNPTWASRVVLHDNAKTMNAFRISVGHEIAHKKKEFSEKGYNGDELQFIKHVTEAYADFYGAKNMCGSRRSALKSSIQYKKDYKENVAQLEDVSGKTHPSWKRRLFYTAHFDFNEKLIEQIAEENNCCGTKVFEAVKQFYHGKDIRLYPKPKPLPRNKTAC